MSFGDLERLVYSGNLEGLRSYLDSHDNSPIRTEYEPYTHIQKKNQARALTMLMSDPRFVFDELFVARMFYFSTGLTHETIWQHPKMKKLLERTKSFTNYFFEQYPNATWKQTAGIGQRFFLSDRVIQYLRKQDNRRLAFVLYPALVRYARIWLQKHYMPGEKGYERSFHHFTTLAAIHTSALDSMSEVLSS